MLVNAGYNLGLALQYPGKVELPQEFVSCGAGPTGTGTGWVQE